MFLNALFTRIHVHSSEPRVIEHRRRDKRVQFRRRAKRESAMRGSAMRGSATRIKPPTQRRPKPLLSPPPPQLAQPARRFETPPRRAKAPPRRPKAPPRRRSSRNALRGVDAVKALTLVEQAARTGRPYAHLDDEDDSVADAVAAEITQEVFDHLEQKFSPRTSNHEPPHPQRRATPDH